MGGEKLYAGELRVLGTGRVPAHSNKHTQKLDMLRAQGRTAVRKALGEFRRTHEEAALAAARRALDPDQWDMLQEVASPATYFA